MLVCSLAEVVSLGAVIPFLAVLTEPETLWDLAWVQTLAIGLGWQTPADMTLGICIAFGIIALGAGSIRVLMIWVNYRLANAIGSDLSTEVYHRTLYQPYSVHANWNSSEVITVMTNEVGAVITTLQGLLQFATAFLISLGLIIALVLVNAQVALLTAVFFGLAYGFVIKTARIRLRLNSQRIVADRKGLIQVLQEGLGAIRDVILDSNQIFYTETYRATDRRLRFAVATNSFLSLYPRYGLEAIAMAVIAGIAWFLTKHESGLGVLSILGAYALGGQRLLPALQQVYLCWSQFLGYRSSLKIVLQYLEQPIDPSLLLPGQAPLPFQQELRFESVSFAYGDDLPLVIDHLSLTIRPGQRVGFIGTTGSGKSTCLDLLMGLLMPTQGEITVDGVGLRGENLQRWQKNIAHVPQAIYLADATIAENIALGIPRQHIDWERIRQTAAMAQISRFIESQPQGYETFVGERGIRLSGGQRQRIGIARALYKQAQVLVFDEATSALDNQTEREVMAAINALSDDLTIIMIAHRLSTVEGCDLIIELSQGRVVAQGTYQELIANSPSFRRMAGSPG